MNRLIIRVAAVACIAPLVSACGGGGGTRAVPATTAQSTQSNPAAPVGVPQSAARGVQVAVHLPLRNGADLDALIARQGQRGSADYHRFLTPSEFRAKYAPSADDLDAAATALRGLGFETRTTSQAVLASAPQAVVEKTFSVKLRSVQSRGRGVASTARSGLAADRAATLPSSLAKLNATVAFSVNVRHVDSKRVSKTPYALDNRYSTVGPYWFTDLKQAYGYPSYESANGAGRTIAIVIDSDVLDSDNALYFGHEHLAPPVVERRPVDGGPPPCDPNGDGCAEASLDVQQSFGSAPGAHIMLYGVPDLSDQSVIDAYAAIVDDNRADVVNSSFGLCELYYTAAYNGGQDFTSILQIQHDIFRQGNAQGITFVSSSGDNGAYDCFDPTFTHLVKGVENPADDPNDTGVGGTDLVTASTPGSLNSSYVRESEFFDPYGDIPNDIWGSGGGVSVLFPKPLYQNLVNTRAHTRTVPDVAMHMGGCPVGAASCNPDDSSDIAVIGGFAYELIGTSASSPEFAGLLAVTEQSLGTRLGNANDYIYALSALGGDAVYRQNIPGDNGYPAAPGYDYVTGNGTPRAAVFAAKPLAPRAGNPQTPTNP
ncbi:MAG TPA: S53 family peptidase [Candidatus Elarobacter sp.]|nr:S53 family peptidase [Candidatus Elarobacter sp.]